MFNDHRQSNEDDKCEVFRHISMSSLVVFVLVAKPGGEVALDAVWGWLNDPILVRNIVRSRRVDPQVACCVFMVTIIWVGSRPDWDFAESYKNIFLSHQLFSCVTESNLQILIEASSFRKDVVLPYPSPLTPE